MKHKPAVTAFDVWYKRIKLLEFLQKPRDLREIRDFLGYSSVRSTRAVIDNMKMLGFIEECGLGYKAKVKVFRVSFNWEQYLKLFRNTKSTRYIDNGVTVHKNKSYYIYIYDDRRYFVRFKDLSLLAFWKEGWKEWKAYKIKNDKS